MNYTPNEPPRAMSAAEIEEILPHRYPFALVDKILDYTPGQWARGVKCVTRTEPFFEGHFPGHPAMPGVLILEALAQTGAVAALSLPENQGKLALFGGKAYAVRRAGYIITVFIKFANVIKAYITQGLKRPFLYFTNQF